jgi:6-phosphogluconolactonase (cycloisomerase 2 family)
MLNWIWKRQLQRRGSEVRLKRLGLERLEERAVPAHASPAAASLTFVYTESNNPESDHNAVLAFAREQNGTLTQIGTFSTHGTGQLNLPKIVGPDDSSQEVQATPDGRFLYAVNQGSNTIAAFRIHGDGQLTFIGTFASGGVQPDSIGIVDGNKLYVSNKGDATADDPGTVAPTITGFSINADGSLSPLANATITLPVGTIPSQNLISPNGQFLFSDIFGVGSAPQSDTLAPFQISGNGALTLAPGGNVAAQPTSATTAPPALLGASANPTRNILYVGLTGLSEVAVFTYDAAGQLTFVGATAANDMGGSGPCWSAVSPDGKFLYTGDTGSNSVGVYSLADPLHPMQIQELVLAGPQTPPGSPPGTPLEKATFQVVVDPSGRFVYAISQNTSTNGTFQEGNQLHILAVAPNGTLSEPHGPVILPADSVPGTAHPQGIAVVTLAEHGHDHHEQYPAGAGNTDAFFASPSGTAFNQEAIVEAELARVLFQLNQHSDSAN